MQEYDVTIERERALQESIKGLECINKKIAALIVRKEKLTEIIIGALGHEHEGQKSYEYDVWKIEVKTPCLYVLNKKRYESGEIWIPKEFNPIKQSVSYTIDKRLCDQFMLEAPKNVKDALAELIDKKPGKAGVTIRERV